MPLHSEQQGSNEKPTLVFLHGFLGNRKDWKKTIKQLKDDFHCITIDLPGHGLSAGNLAPLDQGFEYCNELIKFSLDELDVTSFTLIGYSLGGRIALDYARSQADPRLTHLILESSHIGLTNESEKQQRYHFDLAWAERFSTLSLEESLYQWYEQPIFNDLTIKQKEYVIEKRSHNYGVFLANMLLSTSLANQVCAQDFLATTTLPVTYFHGEKDAKFSKLAALLSETTNVKTVCFNGLGHNTHQQDPINYANNIKALLL